MKSQAQINADKLNKLILICSNIEEKQDILHTELVDTLNILEKLKDIELNIKKIYLYVNEQEKLSKEKWLF